MKTKQITAQMKAFTLTGLAKMYNVSPGTLKRRLLPYREVIGERAGNYFTPRQVALIYKNLGLPEKPKG